MIAVLSKPADQIGVSDLNELIDSEVPESDQIEFKETLSTKDGSPDRWITHRDRIGEKARNQILEETVAFANAATTSASTTNAPPPSFRRTPESSPLIASTSTTPLPSNASTTNAPPTVIPADAGIQSSHREHVHNTPTVQRLHNQRPPPPSFRRKPESSHLPMGDGLRRYAAPPSK